MKKIDYNCVTPDVEDMAEENDCTGLMYKPPHDSAEYEAYLDICDIRPDVEK